MYAYDVTRPDHFKNVRIAASENFRGLTAVINDKPYLVVDREKVEYVLEDENGNRIWVENFDHTARDEQDALIAASRVHEPFLPGTKIGDWTIGNLAFHEGNWHVRNGDTDQIVPIDELVRMLEDESYFKDNFNSNFNVQFTSAEKRAQRTAALQKVAVTIETNLPNNGWHNGCWHWAQQAGLEGTITYPNGTTLELANPQNFMQSMMNGMGAPGGMNSVPITVETEQPDLFWEIWNDTQNRGGGGGNPQRTASYTYALPDTPGEHFLDTMEVTADRSDYDHWNEDADYMWWEEEGKHQNDEPYDDYNDHADVDREGEFEMAIDDGYEAAHTVAPDALTWHYLPNSNDRDVLVAWLDSYQDGQREQGFEGLSHEEYQQLLGDALKNYRGAQPATNYPTYGGWQKGSPYPKNDDAVDHSAPGHKLPKKVNEIYNAIKREHPEYSKEKAMRIAWERSGLHKEEKVSGWTRVAEGEIVPGPGGVPQDIPFNPAEQQSIVHAYEDGDIILEDGTTTFDPTRAYQFLIGAHEFDKAKQVKELIDRSPPSELPAAVIPPDQAQQPQEKLPEEAPLDPTGGQPQPATGAPMQPGAQVPPMPGQQPRASVTKEGIEFHPNLKIRQPYDNEYEERMDEFTDKVCPNCGSHRVDLMSGACMNCGAMLDQNEDQSYKLRGESKEARKDFTHSEQKALINENLEGRARNYDKLDLKGTHYELEQESSFDDFLWQ